MTFPTHMTYHLVIVIIIPPQWTPYFHQIPQLPPLPMSKSRTPCTHLYPLWVKLIMRNLLLIAPMTCVMKWLIMFPHQILTRFCHLQLRILGVIRNFLVTMLVEDFIELIILEHPRLRMPFSPFLNLHTSLSLRIVILKISCPYVLMTVLMTLNLRIPCMSSHKLPALRPTSSELVTVIPLMKYHHMMMTLFLTCVTYWMIIHHHPLIGSKMSLNLTSVKSLIHH